jgi:hypothetical protein
VLQGEGVSIAHPRTASEPWIALTLGARLFLPLGRYVQLALEGGALFPLRRPRFVFEMPRAVVHETPVVGAFSGLSVWLRFP